MAYKENENPSFTLEEIVRALDKAKSQFDSGGPHIYKIRTWMQQRFWNGDQVKWGSEESLGGTGITPNEMEKLACDIMDKVREDFRKHLLTELGIIKMLREPPSST